MKNGIPIPSRVHSLARGSEKEMKVEHQLSVLVLRMVLWNQNTIRKHSYWHYCCKYS